MHKLFRLIEGAARYEAGLIATERWIPAKERAAFIARHVRQTKQVRAARAAIRFGARRSMKKEGK